MARIGSFSPSNFIVGAPLATVQPPDNAFPIFDPEIESQAGLTDQQRVDLQEQIDELSATLSLARDYRGS